jgi:YVTN family beta-propeller protein
MAKISNRRAMTQRIHLVLGLSFFLAACNAAPPSSANYRIYVTNERSGDVSVIDAATHEVIATVPLGKRPRGIHASPDRQTIYVALSGSPIAGPGVDETKLPPADKKADAIGVFDVRGNKLQRLIPAGSDPEEFDLSKDGTLLFCSNEDVALTSIVDIASGEVVASIPVGPEPEGVTTSPDGKLVYVTSEDAGTVVVIDTTTRKAIKTIPVGNRPRDTVFFPDGSMAYVTRENDGVISLIDVLKGQPIQTIELGPQGEVKPMAVILSPDATKAYVSAGRGKRVYEIDTATNMVTASVEVGDRPWGIALSPDGKTLYTANGPSNDVSVVDVATRTVIKKIKVGTGPWGIITLQP